MARTVDEIIADPEASQDELQGLAANPACWKSVVHHPNCPPSVWWLALLRDGIWALRAPAASLMILEDPAKFQGAWGFNAQQWVREGIEYLSNEELQQLLLPCFAHCLEMYDALYENSLPRRAIQAREEYLAGKFPYQGLIRQLSVLNREANRFMKKVARGNWGWENDEDAAGHVLLATTDTAPYDALWKLQHARGCRVLFDTSPYDAMARIQGTTSEAVFQWGQLYQILRQKFPELPHV